MVCGTSVNNLDFELEMAENEFSCNQVLKGAGGLRKSSLWLLASAIVFSSTSFTLNSLGFGAQGFGAVIAGASLASILATFAAATILLKEVVNKLQKNRSSNPGKQESLSNTKESELQGLRESSSELSKLNFELSERVAQNQASAENFRISSSRFQRVLASIPVPCIGCDIHGNIYEWNAAAQLAFHKSHAEVFEHSICELLFDQDNCEVFADFLSDSILSDKEITFELPTNFKGKRSLYDWSLTPIRGGDGQISSLLITAVDITEHIEEQEKLNELASMDAMTKLHNRRAFLEILGKEHANSNSEYPVSIIFVDVDKFKNFNDTYGHAVGDEVLRMVGEVLRNICGKSAFPARYGGEEFIVMAANHDEEEAAILAESIRVAFAERTKDPYGCTASFGVSATFSPETSIDELIEQADQALYAAKEGGRNQVQRSSIVKAASSTENAA